MSRPPVRLYDTLTRSRQELRPIHDGVVRIYSCGPTVYRYVHVGNLRTFMLPDLLCRSLTYLGFPTHQVMNITDVGHLTDDTFDRGEDKMLVSARLENKSTEEISAYYTNAFMADIRKVNIQPAVEYPRATQYIPQMIELIEKLIVQGHAYEIGGTVYYDIATFPAYGRLSRNTTDNLLTGVRGDPDPRKKHPGDFTLWKAAGEHRQQLWPSPWGEGFPGWHIECSAMSLSLLGERFDVHTGGADNALRQLRERVAAWSSQSAPDVSAPSEEWESRFRAGIGNDLDMPAAMALVAELMRSSLPAPVKATFLKRWDAVLGLDLDRPTTEEGRLPDGAAELLEARKKARAAKDFARSDRLREELAALGVKVIDAADGQHIKR